MENFSVASDMHLGGLMLHLRSFSSPGSFKLNKKDEGVAERFQAR